MSEDLKNPHLVRIGFQPELPLGGLYAVLKTAKAAPSEPAQQPPPQPDTPPPAPSPLRAEKAPQEAVSPPPPPSPVEATSAAPLPPEPQRSSFPVPNRSQVAIVCLVAGFFGVASALALTASDALSWSLGAEDAAQIEPLMTPDLPSSDGLIAVKLQARESDSALVKELERLGLGYLIEVTREWNTEDNLRLHGGLSLENMPYFAPMPRPGHEHAFEQLVLEGLGDLQLHLFPFTSQQEVERIAASCGLTSTTPISKWSTWRSSGSRTQINHCSNDGLGICAMLTRKCLDGTFQED